MPAGKWSPDEDAYLMSNQGSQSLEELAQSLGRTRCSIIGRKNKLHLTRNQKHRRIEVGDVFGNLSVILISQNSNVIKMIDVTCKCKCGGVIQTKAANLMYKKVASCKRCAGIERAISRRKPPGVVSINNHYIHYKKGARNRDIEWHLSLEKFTEIVLKNCFWCGGEPRLWNPYEKSKFIKNQEVIDRAWIKVNGIDRVRNDIGYISENCVPCCSKCNYIKSDGTAKDFFQHCKKVVDNLSNKLNFNHSD